MVIELISAPEDKAWQEVKQRALITIYGYSYRGLTLPSVPDSNWKHSILRARHSPIRRLEYSFLLVEVPANVSTHLARHVHAQPFISSLRNDRQQVLDGDAARRDTPVDMILDVNAEELMVIANKRLCNKAAMATRETVREMCRLAQVATPELEGLLVPMCQYHGGICHEMFPCGISHLKEEFLYEQRETRTK